MIPGRVTRQVLALDARYRDVQQGEDGYRARYRDLWFIVTEAQEADGRWWRHASVSRRD